MMARPGLDKHPKFRRLMHMLGEIRSHVRGYLECLWDTAYESGNPLIGDDIDVALASDFPGEPSRFTKAASECGGDRPGFIEMVEGVWHIHDLYQNAPEYVQRRMEREAERNAKGVTISQLRAEAGRKGGLAKAKQAEATASNSEANGSKLPEIAKQTVANGLTPAPAPAPRNTYIRFTPPSTEEVRAYCLERQNRIDPQAFVDYYEARGWKLKGNVPLKSWKAAVRTWEKNGFSANGKPPERKARVATLEELERYNPVTGIPDA